jgi:large subunit ribosomal protein L10
VTKAQKAEVIGFLTEEFKTSNAIAICEYKGMKVKDIESLRIKARDVQSKVQVVKNTLATIALRNAGIDGIDLVDTNIVIWSEDQVSLSKFVTNFEKDSNVLKIKTGYMDGNIVDKSQIEAISKLPSKEELIGMLLSVWTAPARNMASVLQAPLRYMVTALDNYKNTK